MKARALVRVAALSLLLGSPGALAQQTPDYEKAKRRYQNAEEAAAAGEWGAAAREYLVAYDAAGDPVLFYKVGHAFDRAGDCQRALVYYRRYLDEADAEAVKPFREKTEGHIEACEKKVKEGEEAGAGKKEGHAEGEPTGDGEESAGAPEASADGLPPMEDAGYDSGGGDVPPGFADDEPSWQQTAAWASVGGLIAFGTIGAVLALSAESREEDIENLIEFRDPSGNPATYTGNTAARYDDLVDEGAELERYSVIAFAAAGVAAGAAVVFFILDATRDDPERGGAASVEIAPSLDRDALGASARWRF